MLSASRSLWKICWSSSDRISRYDRQSSANRWAISDIWYGRSLTNDRNNSGPSIVPCGTPESTLHLDNTSPSTATHICRSNRNDWIHSLTFPLIAVVFQFAQQTFVRYSVKCTAISVCIFWSYEYMRSFTVSNSCDSQEWDLRKPCWKREYCVSPNNLEYAYI